MKKIRFFMVFVFGLFLFSTVSASSVSVSANKSSVTRGDSVTITATISAGSGIYTTEGSINCSGAGVTATIRWTRSSREEFLRS